MRNLTINISLEGEGIKIPQNSDLIDYWRVLDGQNNKIVNKDYIDKSIIKNGLNIYDDFINEIHSKNELLSLKIFNYSLFNFTKTAQRLTPCWQYNFCIFLSLFQKKSDFLKKKYKNIFII